MNSTSGPGFLRPLLRVLAVLFLPMSLYLSGFLVIALFQYNFYYLLLYFFWMYYDRNTPRKGGRQLLFLRKSILPKLIAEYFPVTLHKTADLNAKKNYIFGIHPHGFWPIGSMISIMSDANGFDKLFPEIKPRFHSLNAGYWIPFQRELLLFYGFVNCDKESIEWLLKNNGTGNASCIVVGGIHEMAHTMPNTMQLTLKNRKGFVKIALKTGSSLVPCITFGENESYSQPKNGSLSKRFRTKIRDITGRNLPKANGPFFPLFPFKKPKNTIVGNPIEVKQIENPSEEDVNNLHDLYIKELKSLFYTHRDEFAEDKEMLLTIV